MWELIEAFLAAVVILCFLVLLAVLIAAIIA